MGDFKQLLVWQRSVDLIALVYGATKTFPPEERFGLVAQMRRASVSVASNIAEGEGRRGDREAIRFLQIARGSLHELDCQLQIVQRLGWLTTDGQASLNGHVSEISRMLVALIAHKRQKTPASRL